MAELLVRVVSKSSADPAQDAKLTKRGDVIIVVPDGWGWSDIERSDPQWRIFKWPSVSESEASALLTPELPVSEADVDNPLLQRRGFNLNLDAAILPAALKAYLADDTRAQAFFAVPSQVTLASIKQKKARR
jgi:hypothetical protein